MTDTIYKRDYMLTNKKNSSCVVSQAVTPEIRMCMLTLMNISQQDLDDILKFDPKPPDDVWDDMKLCTSFHILVNDFPLLG